MRLIRRYSVICAFVFAARRRRLVPGSGLRLTVRPHCEWIVSCATFGHERLYELKRTSRQESQRAVSVFSGCRRRSTAASPASASRRAGASVHRLSHELLSMALMLALQMDLESGFISAAYVAFIEPGNRPMVHRVGTRADHACPRIREPQSSASHLIGSNHGLCPVTRRVCPRPRPTPLQ